MGAHLRYVWKMVKGKEKIKRGEMKGSRVISLIWMLIREKRKMWTHNLLGPILAICPSSSSSSSLLLLLLLLF